MGPPVAKGIGVSEDQPFAVANSVFASPEKALTTSRAFQYGRNSYLIGVDGDFQIIESSIPMSCE